jgi:hypothetical protein
MMTIKGTTKAAICCPTPVSSYTTTEEGESAHNRRPNANSNGQLHLVLHRHPDGRNVLCSIGDNGEEDKTDERLGDVVSLCRFFDGCDQIISTERGDNCNNKEAKTSMVSC